MTIPLVLHPGFPRTATTSLQAGLSGARGNALYLGKLVGGRSTSGWLVEEAATVDSYLRGLSRTSLKPEQMTALLLRAVDDCEQKPHVLLYSNEVLSKPWPNGRGDWAVRQAEWIRAAWGDVRVILTLRNQADLLYSLFLKYLKSQLRSRGPILFLESWLERGGASNYVHYLDYLAYDRLIGCYADVFGSANVVVLQYEQAISPVADFADAVRRLVPGASIAVSEPLPMNVSQPLTSLRHQLARRFLPGHSENWLIRYAPSASRRLRGVLADLRLPESRLRMTPARRMSILDEFRASNRKTEALTGLPLHPAYFADSAGPQPVQEWGGCRN